MKRMSRLVLAFAFTCLCLFTGVSAAQDVTTDYDHHANFERYHTYYWAKVHTEDPLWQSRITGAVDKELQAKGWQRQDSGGDVAITAVGPQRTSRPTRLFMMALAAGAGAALEGPQRPPAWR